MLPPLWTPLIRLGNLFPQRDVHAKCEFLGTSGCFKIRGAAHLLEHLRRQGDAQHLIVPSMGNTALGAAAGAGLWLRHDRRGAANHLSPRTRSCVPWASNCSRLPAAAATCSATRPSSVKNAGAISCTPTWTRFGPTATSPLPPRSCRPSPTVVRWCFPWAVVGS